MNASIPLSREIVLIGGGHAHALLLREWGMKPLPGARLTVINPDATAPYTGMLPGFVAGHYNREALEIDIINLARFAGARVILGWVTAIDREAKRLTIPGRPDVAYDIASVDIGITSNMPSLPGFTEHGIAAKPLGPFAARWQAHLDGTAGPAVVIGGGVAGVELALAMQHALKARGAVSVVEAKKALQGIGESTRNRLMAALNDMDIALYEDTTVVEVQADSVTLSDGQTLPAALTVGAAGAKPFPWLEETGLDLTDGFITVDETLRSITDPNIFAVGDCAHLSKSPRPKAGVFAVRAAPVLTQNLKAAASGGRLAPFRPQTHYLKLISLGGKAALADKYGRSVGGGWAWHWKDRIDQAFMRRLSELPDMAIKLPSERALGEEVKPLCGGCGSKVVATALNSALKGLPSSDDVLTAIGDDAAVLQIGDQKQVLTTDHLRAFWEDPYLMGRITALHAMSDVWAMGANAQAVLAHITLPRMSEAMQRDWLREVMDAASDVFADEDASIVGGHTTMGAEMQLGFTVTGFAEDPITLAGARAGDALLLTRPIGSGTLLAAEMALQAEGDTIAGLLRTLSRSQGDAARHLAPIAHAMTDVTGFGLAGHAARMALASNVTIEINVKDVPLFDGTEELAANGVRSSIWKSNKDAFDGGIGGSPREIVMFDPQTAGGLLAALPPDQGEAALNAIRGMGHDAALIGSVSERSDTPVILRPPK